VALEGREFLTRCKLVLRFFTVLVVAVVLLDLAALEEPQVQQARVLAEET
jgi:hypothetical protein